MSKHLKTPIIVLTGPTASGKSSIGLKLAKEIGGVIINADSKQVYREIPISTAQPDPDKKLEDHWLIDRVPHYMYGNRSIKKPIDLYQYQQEVYKILTNIDKVPILLGGTGLYIDSVIKNYQLKTDDGNKKTLEGKDLAELQEMAGEYIKDLNQSDRKNPHRLKRIIERGGKYGEGENRDNIYLIISGHKEDLAENIRSRTINMFERGLFKEAEEFKKEIIDKDKHFRIIGLQEFRDYFLGKSSLSEVEELINTHTLQYVKKQKTWFRRVEDSIEIKSSEQALPHILNFLSNSTSLFSN